MTLPSISSSYIPALLSMFSLVAAESLRVDAQPAKPVASGLATYMPDSDLGVSCGACHREPLPDAKTRGSDKYVLLREYTYWNQHDLHRRAFEALSSPLGQQMSLLLYQDKSAATQKVACLVCHATDMNPGNPLSEKTPTQFGCELGVNCQACHGPASPWLAEHFKLTWREIPGETKSTKYSLNNLRNPDTRAKVCVSCHVGSSSEGKFVTHEMYAAGHPPLPSFELATFSRDEPRHWRSPSEVDAITSLDPEQAKSRYSYRSGEVESARLVAVGAIATLKATAESISFEPDPKQPSDSLDFAHFNCAACHHDLRVREDGSSDRQRNGFPGVPGRPIPRTWPVWLSRVVIRHAEKASPQQNEMAKNLDSHLVTLRTAFDARPFGDKAAVLKAAGQLSATCDQALQLIDRVTYTDAVARDLLLAIAEQAASIPEAGGKVDYLDSDGAYQLARAFSAIYLDLSSSAYDRSLIPTGPPGLDKLAKDPFAISAYLVRLNSITPLAVRDQYINGHTVDGLLPDHAAYFIQANLKSRLKQYYDYDPVTYRSTFAEIRKKLGK